MAYYILTHRDVPNLDADFYKPLFLSDNETTIDLKVKDYYPDLANMNLLYNELSGIYWIWKNDSDKFKGQCQYRMRPELTKDEIERILEVHKFILHTDYVGSIKAQFIGCHDKTSEIWNLLRSVLKDLGSATDAQLDIWERYNLLFSRNTFYAKAEDYDAFCNWLWPILDELRKRLNFNTMDDVKAWAEKNNGVGTVEYRERLFGFISERLFTLFAISNYTGDQLFVPKFKWTNEQLPLG